MAVRISGGQLEHLVDELILTPNNGPAHPSNLSLPHHVDHFIALNRSSRGLEFSESLLGVHSSLDGAMVLLDNIVQVLHGSWAGPFGPGRRPRSDENSMRYFPFRQEVMEKQQRRWF